MLVIRQIEYPENRLVSLSLISKKQYRKFMLDKGFTVEEIDEAVKAKDYEMDDKFNCYLYAVEEMKIALLDKIREAELLSLLDNRGHQEFYVVISKKNYKVYVTDEPDDSVMVLQKYDKQDWTALTDRYTGDMEELEELALKRQVVFGHINGKIVENKKLVKSILQTLESTFCKKKSPQSTLF